MVAAAAASNTFKDRVFEILSHVPDPEIPCVSVVDLGIVRDVTDDAVIITPTYTGCPATLAIEADIRAALDRAGLSAVKIETTLSPPWSTDWISVDGREKLRAYGIAPPTGLCAADSGDSAGSKTTVGKPQVIRFAPRAPAPPPCPRCGSAHTERLAQFGSTACKALYRCLACREPFDYFKPY